MPPQHRHHVLIQQNSPRTVARRPLAAVPPFVVGELQRHLDRLVVPIQRVLVHPSEHTRSGRLVLRPPLGDAVPPVPQQHATENLPYHRRGHVQGDLSTEIFDVHELGVGAHIPRDDVGDRQVGRGAGDGAPIDRVV